MAEVSKVEGGCAFSEKRKLDQPNSFNNSPEEMKEVEEDDKSGLNKKQKLEIPAENEMNIISDAEQVVESKDAEKGYKGDENDDKGVDLKVESETVDKGKRIAAADKGKAILIEDSDDEEEEAVDYGEYCDYVSSDDSDDSDSDFSDGLGGDSEDDMVN